MEQNKLFELLEKTIKYTPILYKQTPRIYKNENEQSTYGYDFVVEYKHTAIANDSLLFFLPITNSLGPSTLTLRVPKVQDGVATYDDKKYKIEVETNNGYTRPVTKGDIVAYRMCIFRFLSNDSAVLINSPLYNEANFNSIAATNAKFMNTPVAYDKDDDIFIPLATSKQVEELTARVKQLEERIIYGNIDAEEALMDKPSGTIYIRVEE